MHDAERRRLEEDERRQQNWKRWGPYLSERQWSTVREDYSADGDSWRSFPHDHARSRAYRWGEDGHLFSGGFLGMDNIGVFDRSKPLPTGGHLEQADGTAWMAFYSATMMRIALELAAESPEYDDLASKFLEHVVAIAEAINGGDSAGLWDEQDGFYYDRLHLGDAQVPLRLRSMVGIVPLFACEVIEDALLARLPGFRRRLEWFLANRPGDGAGLAHASAADEDGHPHRMLAIVSGERLVRVLRRVLDESELLAAQPAALP
jgi:hypothetical protein